MRMNWSYGKWMIDGIYVNCSASEFVRMFEALADMTDDAAAIAEKQGLGLL